MSHQFYAWDDAAKRAEPELTIEQCEKAIAAIRSLEGHPGIGWTLHYLLGILRESGNLLADPGQPTEAIRYNQGVYAGINIAMQALRVSYDAEQAGGADNEAVEWYERVRDARKAIAADDEAKKQGGQ